jgi:hypothetical protein
MDRENRLDGINHFPLKMERRSFLLDNANCVVLVGNPALNHRECSVAVVDNGQSRWMMRQKKEERINETNKNTWKKERRCAKERKGKELK